MPVTEAICVAELFRIRSTEPKVSSRAFLRDSETPGNFVEQALADSFLEQQAVEAVGKTVRLITDPLQQFESSAVLRAGAKASGRPDGRFPRIPWPGR